METQQELIDTFIKKWSSWYCLEKQADLLMKAMKREIEEIIEAGQPQEITKSYGLCKNCKHYKEDIEYDKVGSCTNAKVMGDKLIFNYCEAFFISEDFGCINYENKT